MHLAQDSLRFGPIDLYSAYRFENHYGDMKRYLRKNDRPLQQLIKRLRGKNKNNFRPDVNNNEPEVGQVEFGRAHFDGPLVENFRGYQFKEAKCGGKWKLSTTEPDNCIMLRDTRVVLVDNFVQYEDQKYVIGRELRNQNDFYVRPVHSSVLSEYCVSNLSSVRQVWNVEHIQHKCVKLPSSYQNEDSFVVFPLIR